MPSSYPATPAIAMVSLCVVRGYDSCCSIMSLSLYDDLQTI